MASFQIDASIDASLQYIIDNTTTLYICSALPATYAEASSTYALGSKALTVGAVGNGDVSGRKCTVPAVTDGSVSGNGTATHYALTSGAALIFAAPLAASQGVTSGNTFTLPAIDLEQPDPS